MNAPVAPFDVLQQERRGVSQTEYRIVGALAAVFRAVETIMGEYSPVGYGTRVASIDCDYPRDDVFVARITRSNSAD